ncbi:HA1F protein, partial [Mystacornis crossleyi]|nr:HA1F protein [Mystacornis crossleyi]
VLHSLRYLRVTVSEPSPGLPRFTAVGYLDGIPFVSYNSERAGWSPRHCEWELKPSRDIGGLECGSVGLHQTLGHCVAGTEFHRSPFVQCPPGLHTLQVVSGCDLLSNGSVRGSDRYGYDGRDFISFGLGSKSFMAADGTAQIIKRFWESDGIIVPELKHELGHTCVEVLKKHVRYGREALDIIPFPMAPNVHVSGKVEHEILTLSCRTYGFYPSTIAVSWMKGDEIWDQETEWGEIAPNSNGTFHTWARIEAQPEDRKQYRCQVEHPGMPEPRIFAW